MILICLAALFAAVLLIGCTLRKNGQTEPVAVKTPVQSAGGKSGGMEKYAVRSVLREMSKVDPEKGIGVYGRYTELTAEGEVPEALSKALTEANTRAKERVEAAAARFLAENTFPVTAAGSAVTEQYRYRNVSYIVNVTRADSVLFSILETELESGLADSPDVWGSVHSCAFRSAVYDTQSGKELALTDFVKEPESLRERLEGALANKYAAEGLYTGGRAEAPAWTADYLGLRFYFDGAEISEEKKQEAGLYARHAVHVSLPYSALDGAAAEAAAGTPLSFIAQLEKNTDYALPHDKRVIRIEKAADSNGYENYRIVIRDGKKEEFWWLEYANDLSDYYVFRAQDKYYFYRLDDTADRGYVYNFASPDGGYQRFENQNAQCFDSFLHEIYLAVPCDPDCVHMRERTRRFMDAASGLNTTYVPHGHYAFRPEQGRGRTWLHFALIDDALALDSRNVGCRLLHEIGAVMTDDAGNAGAETVIPAGEVLKFLRVDGESELYYYMSPSYNEYRSGARDYVYDCELSDGKQVRLVTRYENSFFVDGMYMDRIGEPVTLGAARYEAGLDGVPEHSVVIGGKEYKLIRDLSLPSETGEEIDFAGDIWWKVEHYVGTFVSEKGDAKLVISENGEVSFDFDGKVFKGKLPEKRYYRSRVAVYMEAGYEMRTFEIIVLDKLPPHDPSFSRIRFYSEGLPATNEPSKMPPIEAELLRKAD